ncbi:hypothetical protein BLOT_000616 [Blomia tropicalis]|nr:hypothetical protein BLOT_000616 [Blomia tropicalis]
MVSTFKNTSTNIYDPGFALHQPYVDTGSLFKTVHRCDDEETACLQCDVVLTFFRGATTGAVDVDAVVLATLAIFTLRVVLR